MQLRDCRSQFTNADAITTDEQRGLGKGIARRATWSARGGHSGERPLGFPEQGGEQGELLYQIGVPWRTLAGVTAEIP
jgi:hypothetical protein